MSDAATQVDFGEDIRPIFQKHCLKCHGGVKQAGGVSFVYRSQALGKSKSGHSVVVPGDLNASELYHRVTAEDKDDRMPPADESPEGLSGREIALLKNWIEQGAEWEDHWAFVKPELPERPSVQNKDWARNPIDYFTLRRMEERGLKPSEDADPAIWLRRATLDLTGLPPALEEMDAFLKEVETRGEPAYAKAVDRLLNDSAYGERWATVWLDQVRYADSRGLGLDDRRTIWKYRDWVIDALNRDLPFDEFTIKQLAGDLLPKPAMDDLIATACQRNTQANNEGGTDDEEFRVAAVLDRVNTTWQAWQGMTFGCAQCHDHPYDPFRQEEYYRFSAFYNNTVDSDLGNDEPLLRTPLDPADYAKARELDARIENLEKRIRQPAANWIQDSNKWTAARSMQVRSNNSMRFEVENKESHAEFRAVSGVERGTVITIDTPVPDGMTQLTALRVTGMPLNAEIARKDSEWGFVVSRLSAELQGQGAGEDDAKPIEFKYAISDAPEPVLDPEDSFRKNADGFGAYTRIHYPRTGVFILEKPMAVEPGERLILNMQHDHFPGGSFPLVMQRGKIALSSNPEWTDYAQNKEILALRGGLDKLKEERKSIRSTTTPVMKELDESLRRPTFVFDRGNFLNKTTPVEPGAPASMGGTEKNKPGMSRLDMARWLVDADNPLTARVAVNRFWEQMFGKGIVVTLEDFGSAGEKPTHPELLDYLAHQFQHEWQWSRKKLLREIALSSTYRQSARMRPDLREKDPSNQWLARGPRNRLTAEMVRDHALAVSGALTEKLYGEPVRPPIPDGVWKPFARDPWNTDEGPDRYRRSVYTYVKRSIPYPTFASFDAPSREFCSSRRLTSNTPLQALATLNNEAFDECARIFADRMRGLAAATEERIRQGYRLAASRSIDERRLAELTALYQDSLAAYETQFQESDDPRKAAEKPALTVVARVLLNLDEALTK